MNQRIAAALLGTVMGLATFAGSHIAVSAAAPQQDKPSVTQEEVTKVLCRVLKELDMPELADLMKKLGCDKAGETTTSTTSATGKP